MYKILIYVSKLKLFLAFYISNDCQSPEVYREWSVKIEKKTLKQINHCLRKCHNAFRKPLLSSGC